MTSSTIIPCFRYKDAHAMIEWLCAYFGFQRHAVYEGEGGVIVHAELVCNNAMIMLGSASNESEYSKHTQLPSQIQGLNTSSCYMIVKDVDKHYERAKSGGAIIVIDIRNEAHGGRGYSCKDPEGYLWNFGSYDPWAAKPQ